MGSPWMLEAGQHRDNMGTGGRIKVFSMVWKRKTMRRLYEIWDEAIVTKVSLRIYLRPPPLVTSQAPPPPLILVPCLNTQAYLQSTWTGTNTAHTDYLTSTLPAVPSHSQFSGIQTVGVERISSYLKMPTTHLFAYLSGYKTKRSKTTFQN